MAFVRSILTITIFILAVSLAHPAAAERCPGFDAAMNEVEAALDAVHAQPQTRPAPAPQPQR